jgi:hypothetical protein
VAPCPVVVIRTKAVGAIGVPSAKVLLSQMGSGSALAAGHRVPEKITVRPVMACFALLRRPIF